MKKSIICSLVAVTVCLFSTVAFAATNLTDVADHWAATSIERWVEADVIVVSGDYNPDGLATRGEVADKLVRILKLEEKADLSNYEDIKLGDEHYEAIAKAVKAGLMEGDSATQMRPFANISRQELVVMLNRMLKMSGANSEKLNGFTDAKEVASWAADAMNAFTFYGYMNGYLDNTIRPIDNISRAEVDKLLDFSIGMVIVKSGTYDLSNVKGNVIVLANRVVLKNASGVDNICAISKAVAKTLKVDGVLNSDEVTVVVESESSTNGGGLAGGSSAGNGSGSGSGTGTGSTAARVEILTSGDEYDISNAEALTSADKIVVNVDGTDITIKDDTTLRANMATIFNAMTETDEELNRALNTLSNNADNNEYVLTWGYKTITAMGEPYTSEVLDILLGDGTDDTIKAVYAKLVEAGPSEAEVRALIKAKALEVLPEVIPTFAEAKAFLGSL